YISIPSIRELELYVSSDFKWTSTERMAFGQLLKEVPLDLFYLNMSRGAPYPDFSLGARGRILSHTIHSLVSASVVALPYHRNLNRYDIPHLCSSLVLYQSEGVRGGTSETDLLRTINNHPFITFFATNDPQLADVIPLLVKPKRIVCTFQPDEAICKVKGDLTVREGLGVEELISLAYQYTKLGVDHLQEPTDGD
ncbi:MAG: hypothetical protein KDB07_00340, partial [Planctomycetes bacterium]|nr:hypothetical protein [Planctomycetota bacterium]